MDAMKKFLAAFCLILCLATVAGAQTPVTKYVNTACGNNGDGTANTCAASGGAPGAYNTCSAAEAQNLNLTSLNQTMTIIQDPGGSACGAITQDGWTLDATRWLRWEGLRISTSNYSFALRAADNYVQFADCQIDKSGEFLDRNVVEFRGSNLTFERCSSAIDLPSPDGSTGAWVSDNGDALGTLTIRNTVIYGCQGHCIDIPFNSGDVINVFNNTIVGAASNGIQISADSSTGSFINVSNNLVTGSGGNDYDISTSSATYSHFTNISEDATSPETGGRSKTITYVNAGANDYHLDPGETDAIDAGTDLSGSYGFSDDFNGDSRGATWDIGMDEIPETPSGPGDEIILLLED